jgi:hypothetical protein
MPPKASNAAKNAQTAKNANASNAKNAASGPARNARGRKPLSEEAIQCKREARLHAGRECVKKGDECEIIKTCGQYGVGRDFWPIDRFLEGEDFERLKANVSKKDWFKGKDCINKTMWQTYGDIMSQCNSMIAPSNAAARKGTKTRTASRVTKTVTKTANSKTINTK